MTTILLDPVAWDFLVDASKNIAMASPPYSLAQDVSSACRLFLGELWYDTTIGVPYWGSILGQAPPISYVAFKLQAAALTVVGVATATAYITSISGRTVRGQIQFTTTSGVPGIVSL